MKTKIVGLAGKAGAGKDTAAKFIQEALEQRHRKVISMAFADPIRWGLAAMGVPEQYMLDRSLKETAIPGFNGASYRMLAQTLGTEWGRQQMGRGFWIERIKARLQSYTEVHGHPDFLIVRDVRMHNESAWIHEQGGWVVEVFREQVAPVRAHESEQQQLSVDCVLSNEDGIDALQARCTSFASLLLAEQSLRPAQSPVAMTA